MDDCCIILLFGFWCAKSGLCNDRVENLVGICVALMRMMGGACGWIGLFSQCPDGEGS